MEPYIILGIGVAIGAYAYKLLHTCESRKPEGDLEKIVSKAPKVKTAPLSYNELEETAGLIRAKTKSI